MIVLLYTYIKGTMTGTLKEGGGGACIYISLLYVYIYLQGPSGCMTLHEIVLVHIFFHPSLLFFIIILIFS